jgi:hypothetical protein
MKVAVEVVVIAATSTSTFSINVMRGRSHHEICARTQFRAPAEASQPARPAVLRRRRPPALPPCRDDGDEGRRCEFWVAMTAAEPQRCPQPLPSSAPPSACPRRPTVGPITAAPHLAMRTSPRNVTVGACPRPDTSRSPKICGSNPSSAAPRRPQSEPRLRGRRGHYDVTAIADQRKRLAVHGAPRDLRRNRLRNLDPVVRRGGGRRSCHVLRGLCGMCAPRGTHLPQAGCAVRRPATRRRPAALGRGRVRGVGDVGARRRGGGGRDVLEDHNRVDVGVDLDEGGVEGDRVEGDDHVGDVGAGLDGEFVEAVPDAAGSGDRVDSAGGGVSGLVRGRNNGRHGSAPVRAGWGPRSRRGVWRTRRGRSPAHVCGGRVPSSRTLTRNAGFGKRPWVRLPWSDPIDRSF